MRIAPDQFVAIDIETTGGNADTDRIIEIALIAFKKGEVIHRWQTFVNPGRPIPPMITRLTGIAWGDVADAPPFGRFAPYVQRYMERAGAVVAHNLAPIERRLLGAELERNGGAWPEGLDEICTLSCARRLRAEGVLSAERLRLDALCKSLGVRLRQHHRAEADAEAAGWCLLEMDRRLVAAHLAAAQHRPALPALAADAAFDAIGAASRRSRKKRGQ